MAEAAAAVVVDGYRLSSLLLTFVALEAVVAVRISL